MTKNKKGCFISFEGIDGCGKTTQAKLLAKRLTDAGYETVLTREPGGTVIGDAIREVLLNPEHKEMFPFTELLLYNAARAQHLEEKIFPAICDGKIVISDRFSDSTLAYQGYGRGIDMSILKSLDAIATGWLQPNLTILFNVDAEEGLRRNKGVGKIDRLELEDINFHRAVNAGFLEIARSESGRVRVVNGSLPPEDVSEEVWNIVSRMLEETLEKESAVEQAGECVAANVAPEQCVSCLKADCPQSSAYPIPAEAE